MSDDIPVKVTVMVELQGLCPRDPDKGDAWADEVGDDIEQVLNANPAGGTFAGSYKVIDWRSEEAEQ